MGIGMYFYRNLVTLILLGSQWQEASNFIGIWGLMSSLTIIFSNFASEVYRSKGNPKLSTISQSIHILLLVPVVCISLKYGFKTLYISRALIRLQFIFTNILFMKAFYKLSIKKMLTNIMPATLSALIMGGVAFLLSFVSNSMLWQFASIFICVIVYISALIIAFPKTRKEILSLCSLKSKSRKL